MIEGNEGKDDGVNDVEEDDENENDDENEIVSSFWGQQFPILFIKLIFNHNKKNKGTLALKCDYKKAAFKFPLRLELGGKFFMPRKF